MEHCSYRNRFKSLPFGEKYWILHNQRSSKSSNNSRSSSSSKSSPKISPSRQSRAPPLLLLPRRLSSPTTSPRRPEEGFSTRFLSLSFSPFPSAIKKWQKLLHLGKRKRSEKERSSLRSKRLRSSCRAHRRLFRGRWWWCWERKQSVWLPSSHDDDDDDDDDF